MTPVTGSSACYSSAAMPSRGHSRWFIQLLAKLLQGDPETLRLLGKNPFPHSPPRFVRALYYSYSLGKEKWWDRELIGEYLPPLSLDRSSGSLQLQPGVGRKQAKSTKI